MALYSKLPGLFLIFFMVLMVADSGQSKKTIKIHVPYFVKHIHHYKKVYVPKVQVIKHEHHHKKEHDHHHHHHDHHDHGRDHYHSYDKAGHGYADESSHYDTYYDEIDSRNYDSDKYATRKGKINYRDNPQYKGWKDVDGSEYKGEDSIEDEDDEYTEGRDYSGGKSRGRSKPSSLIIPIYRKKVRSSIRRSDDLDNVGKTTVPDVRR